MATDFSEWKQRNSVSVTTLFLDPFNPRIPIGDGTRDQSDLIAYLVDKENVYSLAKRIVDKGFMPIESVVAVSEKASDGKEHLYVVEGNRRLAALKGILSPKSVPDKHRSKFRKLSSQAALSTLKKIPVLIAPSREAAYPMIMDRHTHTQVEAWRPASKAAFVRRMLDEGYTVAQIAEMGSISAGKIQEALRADALYRAACSLDLDDKTQEIVHDTKAFKLTTLERLFDYKPFRDEFGVEYDAKNLIKGKVKKEEFVRGFKRVVSDVANNKVTSRSVQDDDGIKDYLKKLGTDKPNLKQLGRFKIGDLITEELEPVVTGAPPVKPKRRAALPKNVIPHDLRPSHITKSARVRKVFNELRNLDLVKWENASSLLLRTLIDLAAHNYVLHHGRENDLVAFYGNKPKQQKPDYWSPSLRQTLIWIFNESKIDLGIGPQALTAARKFATDKDSVLCLDELDKFTHNTYSPPSPDVLRNIWTRIDPWMRVFLTEPD